MTAPSVPPKTMSAAVIWAMSRSLPPSRSRPPEMPPNATIRPARVAMSGRGRRDLFSAGFVSAGIEGGAPCADAFEDFVGGFEDGEFLRVEQGDDGVGGAFDLLYEVGVEEDGALIEPCYRDQVEKWNQGRKFSGNLI